MAVSDTPAADGGAAALRAARWVAIGLIAAAVACFSVLDMCAKLLVTSGYPAEQVVFARYASNAAILLLFVNPWTVPRAFVSAKPFRQTIRAVLLVGSSLMNFVALKYLQLAEANAIMFATPFITAILAGVLFKQWIGPWRWLAIACGFVGVLVVVRPGLGGLHWAAGLCLVGACCYAVYNLMTRDLAAYDPSVTTITLGSLIGALVAVPLVLVAGQIVWPQSLTDWILMGATGAMGLLGHWFLILAHRRASAQDLAPFTYTQIVWMILIGFLVFGDIPGLFTLIGAGIVVASGLYLLILEQRGVR